MIRRRFWLLAVAWASISLHVSAAERRPNILFVVSDDLNVQLGCYGREEVRTPSIDRLARRGTLFRNAYCQSPLCNPSRVSFLSGLRPDRTGVYTLKTPTRARLANHVFLPEFFKNNGYNTVQNGKIFHTGEGFEDPRSWDVAHFEFGKQPEPSQVLVSGNPPGPEGNTISWASLSTPDAHTPDGIVARRSVAAMEGAVKKGQPFFLGVGFRRPHAPYAAPRKYFDLYPAVATSLPAAVPPRYAAGILPAALNHAWGPRPLTPRETREVRSAYFSCVSYVDAQVGVLLDALDRLKLWDDTIVVFFGDHGYLLGEHGGLWHKKSLFEESCQVPLIVYAPGAKAPGKTTTRLVELVDLYPTLAELAGLSPPTNLDGRSFAPLLDDAAAPGRTAAFSLIARGEDSTENVDVVAYLGRSVRTDRWRYTEWDDGARGVELYDHQADPRELHNVANDPAHATAAAELRRLVRSQSPVASVGGR